MKQLTIKHLEALATATDWQEKVAIIQQATESNAIDTINWEEYPYRPKVKFHIAWQGNSLFILYDVQEKAIRAVNTEYHSHVYEDSCVEFFLQHEGETVYRNFEMNCIGTTLAALRRSRTDFDYLDRQDMDRLSIHSTLSQEDTQKEGPFHWQLLAEIPFDLLGIETDKSPSGKSIRANFYKCGDKTETTHFLSWNPIHTESPNFHCPEFFGRVTFE